MPRRPVIATPAAQVAARMLGTQIRLARLERRMTAARLAELVGVTPRTMTAIERGDASVTFGHVLNAAVHAGVALFDETDPRTLERVGNQLEQALTFVPSNVRNRKERSVDVDF